MGQDKVIIELAKDEALVLFEFLANRHNRNDLHFDDQAEQRVLWNIEGALEKSLAEPFRSDYLEILTAARNNVRDKE